MAFTGLFLLFFILITPLVIGAIAFNYWSQFSNQTNLSLGNLNSTIQQGWRQEPIATDQSKIILVLGTDNLENRPDAPPLTDTMLLVGIDLKDSKINLLPLPRDLWQPDYQTKINALLAYGQDRNPGQPTEFPTVVISDWLEVPIHHTLVVSLNDLENLIDNLGGVEVQVAESFTDDQFPRTDVDVTTVSDPALLFTTVSFKAGSERMSGQRALEYIRSRHATGDNGTDLSRSTRQLAVMQAILSGISQPDFWRNPSQVAAAYNWYEALFAAELPLPELVATAKPLLTNLEALEITNHQLPIGQEATSPIFHPGTAAYNGQWVYEIRDLAAVRSFVDNTLF